MAQYEELVQSLTWLVTNRIQQKIEYTRGLLGDGNGRVRVSASAGSPDVDYVYVRPDRFSNRTFKVFNKRVQGQDGDPVIIGELPWEPDLIQVVDLDWAAYADVGWGDDITTTNRHGITHQWRDGAPGIDTFNVYRRQLGDLKTYSLESGTLSRGVSPYSLDIYGTQYQWPGTQSFSLAGAVPGTTGTARMALVFWSPASGTSGYLGVASGTVGSGAEATILNRPVTPEGAIPSAFVKLAGGQSSITEFDIFDAREPFRPGIIFNTGSFGLSADQIPIADDSGLYTGTTVEAALDQIGFDGARVSKVYESDFGALTLQSDATGHLGIGSSETTYTLEGSTVTSRVKLLVEDAANTDGLTLVMKSNTDARPANLILTKSTAAEGAVVDNELIGRIGFEGHDGTDYNLSAAIDAEIDGTPAANTVPMALLFKTSETNSSGLATRFSIAPDGSVIFQPGTDSTTAWQVLDADGGTPILNVDSTNERLGIGTSSPDNVLHIDSTSTVLIERRTASTSAIVNVGVFRAVSSGNMADDFGPTNLFSIEDDAAVSRNIGRIGFVRDGADTDGAFIVRASTGGNTEVLRITTSGDVGINGATSPSAALDIAAGDIEFEEMTAPGAGAANTARLYAVDNGAGKTQLAVIFNTGAAQILATQP